MNLTLRSFNKYKKINNYKENIHLKYPALVITSAIRVSAPFVAVQDEKVRISSTILAISEWLKILPELEIVICDGSDYNFAPLIKQIFSNSNIECLCFRNDEEKVRLYGKGYGEGEIIEYALKNSRILDKTNYFAKCTSKLYVKNFLKILDYWNGIFICDAHFQLDRRKLDFHFGSIDTRFYITTKDYYINELSLANKNVRDYDGKYLEHCFMDVVVKSNLSDYILPISIKINGLSGTTGNQSYQGLFNYFKTRIKKYILIRTSKYQKHFRKI